jgi:hypothetical protein
MEHDAYQAIAASVAEAQRLIADAKQAARPYDHASLNLQFLMASYGCAMALAECRKLAGLAEGEEVVHG